MKKIVTIVAPFLAALFVLGGCATGAGYQWATEADKAEVKEGKYNPAAAAQIAFGCVVPETGESCELTPQEVKLILSRAVSCQEQIAPQAMVRWEVVARGAADGLLFGAVGTGLSHELGYSDRPNVSGFSRGARLGGPISMVLSGYDRDIQASASLVSAIAQCAAKALPPRVFVVPLHFKGGGLPPALPAGMRPDKDKK